MTLKLHYDAEFDILHLAEDGAEDEVVEVYPGVTLELDRQGSLIGIEVVGASKLLDGPGYRVGELAHGNTVPLPADLKALDDQLRPQDGKGYREYFDSFTEQELERPWESDSLSDIQRVLIPVLKQMAEVTPSS